MTDIYVAQERHECDVFRYSDEYWRQPIVSRYLPEGSVHRCECGRYWWRGKYVWQRVRWWNFSVRRRIRIEEDKHTYRGPGFYIVSDSMPEVHHGPLTIPRLTGR